MTECSEWEAWYNRMPGVGDDDLHVSGKCGLESSNIEVVLTPGNEGIVDDPEVFVLELKFVRPSFGDTQYIEKDVEWHGDAGEGIKVVRIQGDVTETIEVRDVT
jgi:hypothetical protein